MLGRRGVQEASNPAVNPHDAGQTTSRSGDFACLYWVLAIAVTHTDDTVKTCVL